MNTKTEGDLGFVFTPLFPTDFASDGKKNAPFLAEERQK